MPVRKAEIPNNLQLQTIRELGNISKRHNHPYVTEQLVCSKLEVKDPCATPCPPTCETPNPPACPTFTCSEGCLCKPGLIRYEATKECIPPNKCPKVPTCNPARNEEYSRCASLCPRTCQTPCREPVSCPAVCVRGCVCKKGLIRDEITKKCIKPEHCPKCETCKKEHEEWTPCGAACVLTCQNVLNPPYCPAAQACTKGCVCENGFIRDEDSGECITLEDCIENEILKYKGKRREAKIADNDVDYKIIHREIIINIKEAKEAWIANLCKKIEELERKRDTFNMHKKIKEVPRTTKRKQLGVLKDRNGSVTLYSSGHPSSSVPVCCSIAITSASWIPGLGVTCGSNEIYQRCPSPCPTTCLTIFQPQPCWEPNPYFPFRCDCLDGYARDPLTNSCIPVADCYQQYIFYR
ncbi:hypothetical protein ILUMI_26276 [Ignelater luminosus]|uniref:TIL domain-containing protein n=1 Tax=Ignelater luminosus TaxID=2038154 RepID=A0A8K0C8U3_IGNLU|nr:hypothetical protein ILUMI_26276 [Ignelater luminosus]